MSDSIRQLLIKIREKLLEPLTIPKKELNLFLRQFSHLLEAGILPNEALKELSKEKGLKNIKRILERINKRVEEGEALSEAFDKEVQFDPLLISMIRTGEATGELPSILQKVSSFYEKELKIERKIKGALTYPILLMVSLFFILIVLFSHVIPTFVLFFESAGEELPLLTRILIRLARSRNYFVIGFLMFVVILLISFIFSRNNNSFKLKWDYSLYKITPFKGLIKQRRTQKLFYFLYLISFFGVDLMEGLEILMIGEKNLYIKNKMSEFVEDLRQGKTLSQSIKDVELYDDLGILFLRTGEESSNIIETLEYSLNFYEQEMDYSIEKAMSLLQPILILFMAGIVGFVVLAIAIPLFDLMNTIPM